MVGSQLPPSIFVWITSRVRQRRDLTAKTESYVFYVKQPQLRMYFMCFWQMDTRQSTAMTEHQLISASP